MAQDGAASLLHPIDVATTEDGVVFIADRKLPGIWKYADGKLTLFFQADKKFGTPLNAIRCLAVDSEGRLLAGDSAAFNVYRFDADAKPQALANGRIGLPMGLAVNAAGDIFVSDGELHRIVKLSQPKSEPVSPEVVATVAAPRGLAIDGEDRLWILSGTKDPVRRIASDGKVEVIVAGFKLDYAGDIAARADGSVVVSDSYADTIFRVTESGELDVVAKGAPLVHPSGIALQGDQWLVVDSQAKSVFQVDNEGKIETLISSSNESP